MAKAVEMRKVNSSMFTEVGYSDDTWVLRVVYKSSGLILDYQGIGPELYDEMMAAPSIGKFFTANIKGQYKAIGDEVSKQAGDAPLQGGITDDEIRAVEPGWNGREIIPALDSEKDFNPKGEMPVLHVSEIGTWPTDADSHTAITKQTQGELLPAWSAPDTAAEALDLLAEHKTEIDAIIAQHKQVGA